MDMTQALNNSPHHATNQMILLTTSECMHACMHTADAEVDGGVLDQREVAALEV